MNEQKKLIELIRCMLTKSTVSWGEKLSLEEREKIIEYADKQGLLPFLQDFDCFLQKDCYSSLFSRLVKYAASDSRLESEKEVLLEAFEKNGIYCIPLKGMLTKHYYPSTEYRSMGDLDILYKPEQTKKLIEVMEGLGYQYHGKSARHELYDKQGCTVEMHKEMLMKDSPAYAYFEKVWERAERGENKQFVQRLSLEDHYIFTLCHLRQHFVIMGVGIRMVLDIHILSQLKELNWAYVEKVLKEERMDEFERHIRNLAKMWFSGDGVVRSDYVELEKYVLQGGIFGDWDTGRMNLVIYYRSKASYLWHILFPPYDTMEGLCPWLRRPILLPAAWIYRWWEIWKKKRYMVKVRFGIVKELSGEGASTLQAQKAFFAKYGI